MFNLAWLLSGAFLTAEAALPLHADAMPLDEVTHGQMGRCYTVFEGERIEPFDFEVKGIMRDYLGPQGHVVLARLRGEKAEYTGVVAGMSGSPCFIGDKLVGALSYAFASFAKEPIAGITPIGAMRAAARASKPHLPWRLAGSAPSAKAEDATRQMSTFGALEPIATPIAVGGCPESVRRFFADDLANLGLGPVHNTARSHSVKTAPLSPGSPIAVVLMRGDMDMAATGTVTWVENKEVLAFGHPFMGGGPVSLPLAEASILNTMVSAQRSFKMAATGQTVGELTQDRLPGLVGQIGGVPHMVPLDGTLTVAGLKHTFHLEIARDVALTPKLVAMGLSGALTGRVEAQSRGTVQITGVLAAAGEEDVPIHVVVASEHDEALLSQAALGVARTLSAAWDTPFGLPDKLSLKLDVQLDETPVEERIEAFVVDRHNVRAGEKLDVGIQVRRRGQGTEVLEHTIVIPRDWAHQRVALWVAGAAEAQALVRDVEGSPAMASRADVMRALQQRRLPGHLYVMATRLGTGLRHQAQVLDFLPPSTVTLMQDAPGEHLRPRGVAYDFALKRGGTVTGVAHQELVIAPSR